MKIDYEKYRVRFNDSEELTLPIYYVHYDDYPNTVITVIGNYKFELGIIIRSVDILNEKGNIEYRRYYSTSDCFTMFPDSQIQIKIPREIFDIFNEKKTKYDIIANG